MAGRFLAKRTLDRLINRMVRSAQRSMSHRFLALEGKSLYFIGVVPMVDIRDGGGIGTGRNSRTKAHPMADVNPIDVREEEQKCETFQTRKTPRAIVPDYADAPKDARPLRCCPADGQRFLVLKSHPN